MLCESDTELNEDKESDTGSQCCGVCFPFKIVNVEEVTNLMFYPGGGNVVIVTYVKDGKLYFSISFDCGLNWQEPREVLEIGGNVKDIQISAKDKQFVIVLVVNDSATGKDVKKAVSGEIDKQNYKFDCKECVKHEAKGRLINSATGFRPWFNPNTRKIEGEESVDFTYEINENGEICLTCNGHMCIVK